MSARLKTYTLGCKVNQYETQYVREGLLGIGYAEASADEAADLCIVNTCTVTGEGDAKSRQVIRRMHRDNPHARIVVMGCYATRAPAEIARLPGVAEIITDKRELPDLLGRFGVVDIPQGITGLSNRHRAYVKVQDGCLLRCSYCIIPKVRPQMYSRPLPEVLDEVRGLVDRGFREVVLTGIHLGHYGVDFNRHQPKARWVRLSRLVRELCQMPGEFRLRLSSIEATEVTRELVEVMSDFPKKVCPHLHVCLQSGSDSVLRRMRRRWSARQIIDRCQWVQSRLDQPALTTDVIVGFPGETDAEFEETLTVCRQIGVSKIHMFPFSPRRGTPAAELPDQIPKKIKMERGREVSRIEAALRDRYAQSLVGSHVTMLVENVAQETNSVSGTTCRYLDARIAYAGTTATDPDTVGAGELHEFRVDSTQSGILSERPRANQAGE